MRKSLVLAALGASLATVPAGEARAEVVVLAAGDIASCAPDRTQDTATGNLIEGLEGTVLALGDLAYDKGTATEFANCYDPVWGSFKARTKPVPGNHEYQTPGAVGFYGYFAGLPKYYKFTLGSWTLYALNPYVASGPGSAQAKWFENALKADPNRCQIMYWHPAYISSGNHGDSDAAKNLFAIGYEHRVEIALAGHDHSYERFAEMRPDRRPVDLAAGERGVRLFTVGTGGAPQRGKGATKAGSQRDKGATKARGKGATKAGLQTFANGYGVLQLTLGDAGSYAWSFKNAAGSSISDSGSGTCLPATSARRRRP
jgi:hypothetical protein